MKDNAALDQNLIEVIRLVNEILAQLDDERFQALNDACILLEDASMQWGITDRRVIRTWIATAADLLKKATAGQGEE